MRLAGLLLSLVLAITAVGRYAGPVVECEAVESPDALKAETGVDDSDEDPLGGDQLAVAGDMAAALDALRSEWGFALGAGREKADDISFPPWG
jgi:hypothetical protein